MRSRIIGLYNKKSNEMVVMEGFEKDLNVGQLNQQMGLATNIRIIYRNCANRKLVDRFVVEFSGMIKLELPGDLWSTVVQENHKQIS